MISRIVIVLFFLFNIPSDSHELHSLSLLFGIECNGIGDFELLDKHAADFSRLSGNDLEAFRQGNAGSLVFAVDLDELAIGSEDSESQGVAVAAAWIDVRLPEGTYRFDEFTTQTKAVLAKEGESSRRLYFTLIGNNQFDRVVRHPQSAINASSFDATLTIPINMDLSDATSVRLHVRLLQPNVQLGDPEAFYGISGGHEKLAIITGEDAGYLDRLKPGRQRAPIVVAPENSESISGYAYYPAANDYYLAAYEDQFPRKGDYDFNDLIVAYRVYFGLNAKGKVKTVGGEGYLVAKGGNFEHDWYLNIPLPQNAKGIGTLSLYTRHSKEAMERYPKEFIVDGNINIKPFENISALFFDPNSSVTNTTDASTYIPGLKFVFSVVFEESVDADKIGPAPFDPYLYVWTTGYEIHLPNKKVLLTNSSNKFMQNVEFKDKLGYPFALLLPAKWRWPKENVDLGLAYPHFIDFIKSGGRDYVDWYLEGDESVLIAYGSHQWCW